ncbi:TPA: hypothetical protein N0F65_001422 [Lagenidium giganteum]|uniref:non-specific serine/threonine protein kinase n=1 Tax=Lagenidium giganteum TaxID=4803 RepID=A0AAV2Z1J1_9STRA|nr:TPA: hypothetical protein N0F65_001422 [Lagenidium giganteum]
MDKYIKLEKIGKGSFGCAYLVAKKSEPQGKKYVVKEILLDPRDQSSALREAKLLAALDHPNIIACKESFLCAVPSSAGVLAARHAAQHQQQMLCIVTEFADAGDLRKRLTERQRQRAWFSETEVLDLLVQMCLALKHLHDRKIIHRDIKPENVFLMRSNVVKLGDFGVATVLSHTLACAETLTGTPYYTSPEICLGKKYNHKTDIWSLGCMLYEMLTFTHAFDGRNQRQLFSNIVNATFAPLSGNRYSARMTALVHDMLAKNPKDRPSVATIMKKPLLLERIQGFLSERALADELNHTVLHGQHIFRRPAAQNAAHVGKERVRAEPDTAVRRAEPVAAVPRPLVRPSPVVAPLAAPPPAPVPVPVVAARKLGVNLKKTSSLLLKKKKPSTPRKSKAIASPSPVTKRTGAATPKCQVGTPVRQSRDQAGGCRDLATPRQQLLDRKKAIAQKAKKDAQRRQERAQAHIKAAAKPAARKAAAASPVKANVNPPKGSVGDRIAAFNAQWQAQKDQLLHNLPPPPSAAQAAPPPAPAAAAAPPPPPAPTTPKVVEAATPARKPVSAAAARLAAGKQHREALRQNLRERKLELQKQAKAKPHASPLDDPIILVQNLPRDVAVPPLPPPAAPAVPIQTNGARPSPMMAIVPPADTLSDDDVDEEEEIDGEPQDTDARAENQAMVPPMAAPVNLEYERMVLQLKSVVDCGDLDQDDDDEEDEEDDGVGAATSPLPSVIPEGDEAGEDALPSYSAPRFGGAQPVARESGSVLEKSVLVSPDFQEALRQLLRNPAATAQDGKVPQTRHADLIWMRDYIQKL